MEMTSNELLLVNGGASCGGGNRGGSCGGGGSYGGGGSGANGGGNNSSLAGNCGGRNAPNNNFPEKQVCIAPDDYHCDIYAWNLAIDNGLDPSVGNKNILDLNNHTVDTMYNTYYKDKVVAFDSSAAGKKGVLVYDWGGTSSAKDHVEFVEIASDGKGYTLYATDGIDTPKIDYRLFSNDPNGSAGAASSAVFIPFN